MATDLTGLSVRVSTNVRLEAAKALTLSTPADALTMIQNLSFTFGTGNSNANQAWHGSVVVGATSTSSVDLSGSLINAFGGNVNFAKVQGLLIKNTHASSPLLVGGAAANAWVGPFGDATDVIAVPPGGCLLLAGVNGWTVTAGTADILQFENEGGTALTLEMAIWGISA